MKCHPARVAQACSVDTLSEPGAACHFNVTHSFVVRLRLSARHGQRQATRAHPVRFMRARLAIPTANYSRRIFLAAMRRKYEPLQSRSDPIPDHDALSRARHRRRDIQEPKRHQKRRFSHSYFRAIWASPSTRAIPANGSTMTNSAQRGSSWRRRRRCTHA